jgi:hypothetical protein
MFAWPVIVAGLVGIMLPFLVFAVAMTVAENRLVNDGASQAEAHKMLMDWWNKRPEIVDLLMLFLGVVFGMVLGGVAYLVFG